MWITTRTDRLPVDSGEVLRVTSVVRSPGTVDPKRLQDLKVAAHAFLDAHPGGIMVLDGLDALSLHNGVERVVRIVEELHDEVSTRSAVLFVFVDRHRANPRLLAMLARELDPLSEDGASPPDLIVA